MNNIVTLLENATKDISNCSFQWEEIKKLLPPLIDLSIIERYGKFLNSLINCRKIAVTEYEYIQTEMHELSSLLNKVNDITNELDTVNVNETVIVNDNENNDNKMSQKDVVAGLKKTAECFAQNFRKTISELKQKNNELGEELKDFKIVLFGRTKAGKSTVREALTKGNGSTIGKGSQSTTVEVNQYSWYNLKVYDTPGILSVKDTNRDASGIGDEERKALALLKMADISIFMFATDNIESAELNYLEKIVTEGKDILILLNVKSDISDYRKFLLRKKNLEISIEKQKGHIERIRQKERDKSFDILPIHAQAGFFSRAEGNSMVEDFYKRSQVSRTDLYELSNFAAIRDCLVQNIEKHGLAIRARTIREFFISNIHEFAVANKKPLEKCKNENIDVWGVIKKKRDKIENKFKDFDDKLLEKISVLVHDKIDTGNIASECIENKYSQEKIKSRWQEECNKLNGIPNDIINEFMGELKRLINEMLEEINFIFEFSDSFEKYESSKLPWKEILKGGGFLASIGAAVVAAATTVAWPVWILGLLAAGLSTIAGFFKSKETKISELSKKLDDNLNKIISSMHEQIQKNCKEKWHPLIKTTFDDMEKSQEKLNRICENFLEINSKLFAAVDKNTKAMENRLKELERGA